MKNNFFFYKCVQFLKKNTSVSRKSLLDRYKKCQFDNFTASIDGVPTSWHTLLQKKQPKRPKRTAIDQAHMQLRLRVRALSLWIFIQVKRSEQLKTKIKPWIRKSSKSLHRHLFYYFSLLINVKASKEENSMWNRIWRRKPRTQ